MEQDLRVQIDDTWEYAVRNEQYSRKNNIRIYGLEENPNENLQEKIIGLAKEELGVEIKDEEIEIAHRIGQTRRSQSKPRAVIIKFLSNKSKMQLLSKRKLLKGKSIAVMEDMASDLAKRLKKLKDKSSVEKAWFVNGKIRFIHVATQASRSCAAGITFRTLRKPNPYQHCYYVITFTLATL